MKSDILAAKSKAAILLQVSPEHKVLFKKNIHKKLHPASLTKLMAILIILDYIDNGIITWSDKVETSKNAASTLGSKVYLEAGKKYSLEDLFKAMIIASGNDATVALAEYISGSVDNFVREMNKKAAQLRLNNSRFINPHGLSEKDHYSSIKDIVKISLKLLKRKEILKYSSSPYYYLQDGNNKQLENTNKLIRKIEEVDGLKTGRSRLGGFCLVATAIKDEKRILAVVLGEPSEESRDAEVINMIKFGFKFIN